MPGQSWNAAAFLIAEHALAARANIFDAPHRAKTRVIPRAARRVPAPT
jgi:hypothetical protein